MERAWKIYSSSRQWAAYYHLRDLIILYGAAVRPDNLDIFTPVNLIVSPLLAVNISYFRNRIRTWTFKRKAQTPGDFFERSLVVERQSDRHPH